MRPRRTACLCGGDTCWREFLGVDEIIYAMDRRFTSENSVAVERAHLRAYEWTILRRHLP